MRSLETTVSFLDIFTNYNASDEDPITLRNELYRMRQVVQFFVSLFRASDFDVNARLPMYRVFSPELKSLLKLPSLRDLSDQDLSTIFFRLWLNLMAPSKPTPYDFGEDSDDYDVTSLPEWKSIFSEKGTLETERLLTAKAFLLKVIKGYMVDCHEYLEHRTGLVCDPFPQALLNNGLWKRDRRCWQRFIERVMKQENLIGLAEVLRSPVKENYLYFVYKISPGFKTKNRKLARLPRHLHNSD
ncbi:hypothetical protein TWF730_002968 [Orbilia blumenaviensis]|uniref:Maturase K n=1 Tax=Orbilia blumenaviensis TaxID=1796055 RepID=A0AAV9U8C0_9PEZI